MLLTLAAYAAGMALQSWCRRHSLVNPTLIAIGIVAVALIALRIDHVRYLEAARPVHWLLGPAVVGLAVPLYRHIGLVRGRTVLMIVALLAGSVTAIISGTAAGWWFHLSRSTLLSLAPRSATTAVSMAIATEIGGIPAVTAVLTILTGIIGASLASPLFNVLRIEDPVARGFGMGVASHGIATARAFQESETAGTFAGLAMALNAVVTAILVPLVVRLFVSCPPG
ncbi:MAG TPA: LrgB family protein [Acetobacteraceae bacterium]|nr:LrgB family protein [Acetobacteraceae bacterium]